jgi:2-methylisocitrate lyase-like PEP mutase family enzyme
VADSIGKADGEGMSFEDLLARVEQITAAVDVPVSVDAESGYGVSPQRLIDGLLGAGAVGFNLEDTVHSEGKRLRSVDEHADLVGALRAAADDAGVHVVINARTDLFIRNDGDDGDERSREEQRSRDRVDRAIARLTAAAEKGADSLFPAGVRNDDALRRLTRELPLPVSVATRPDQDDRAALAELGVGRISFGPFWQAALTVRSQEILQRWR